MSKIRYRPDYSKHSNEMASAGNPRNTKQGGPLPERYDVTPIPRIEMTPALELAFWRDVPRADMRVLLMRFTLALALKAGEMLTMMAIRDALRLATDLEVLRVYPSRAPHIVAIRDGVMGDEWGDGWRAIPVMVEPWTLGDMREVMTPRVVEVKVTNTTEATKAASVERRKRRRREERAGTQGRSHKKKVAPADAK